ncbi:MAG: ketopantoate reductase family protein [Lachnospiraceae bacterium]|jgi:2-dehydropantoate 2-reductase|nr:ketopantoate reductase family protein [Lachnospiraceae bacterium]
MRIAVIGAGAMGSIYGGHLSLHNDVYLIDTNQTVVDHINQNGLILQEDGKDVTYHPTAVTSTQGIEPVDLVILFVKSLFSKAALSNNQGIIGPNTYLMTLQNGSGHEDILAEFAPESRIIIGTTEDNGAVLGLGHVRRGGSGKTNIGMLTEDKENFLAKLKECLDSCGFQGNIHENIRQLIWNKLFTNVSLSAVTGVLQVPMGFIAGNEHAWAITKQLIHEAVAVAHGLGLEADEEDITEKVRQTSLGSPEGITSICADLRDGRKTEVNTISGSVVRASKKCGVPAPTHEMIVELVHAMEERSR